VSPALQRLWACNPTTLPASGAVVTDGEADVVADALAHRDALTRAEAGRWCSIRAQTWREKRGVRP
jgi:hypothetical protein